MKRIALDRPPSTAEAWLLAIRPKTLPAAVAGVVVGCAVSAREGGFAPPIALAALAVALLLQIAANLANDVYDFQRGADTNARVGPVRVTHAGLLSPRQVMGATALTIAAAIAVGLYLVAQGGWPIFLLGLLAVVSAVAYTAGPAPLGYLGLGEAFVFLFFGFAAVAGTAYVQTRTLTPLALMASVPLGAIVSGVLVVNNLRDIDSDRRIGKNTLAVRLGRRFTCWEYALLLHVPFFMAALLALQESRVALLAPLVLLPWAAHLARRIARAPAGAWLNRALASTAKLGLVFAVLLGLGAAL
jgi:1,4-dihydroxy-2-naphthoate polyprenyltransferase